MEAHVVLQNAGKSDAFSHNHASKSRGGSLRDVNGKPHNTTSLQNNNITTRVAGLVVESYGTGTQVRLPGKSAMEPRIFKFGTPYAEMYRSLAVTPEDEAFFLHNGVLQLCKRGASVKVIYDLLLFSTNANRKPSHPLMPLPI